MREPTKKRSPAIGGIEYVSLLRRLIPPAAGLLGVRCIFEIGSIRFGYQRWQASEKNQQAREMK